MMAVRVNLNNAAINAEIMRRGGRVDRNVKARAQRVERRAKQLAPVRSGAMKRRIKVDRNRHPSGKFDFGYSIVSPAPHSGYVHDGTRRHFVMVQNKRVLSPKRKETYGRYAWIPAIKGRPFMTEALSAALGD